MSSLNLEVRSITPEGGDVRIEEVDLDAERAKTQDASMEVSIALNELAKQYDSLADEANRLLNEHGRDEDLQTALSGLSDIIQRAAHASIELKARAAPGTSAEQMLAGNTLDGVKDSYEYSIEGMQNRLKQMKVAVDALNRQDRLEEAREDVGEVQNASEIAKGIVAKTPQEREQLELGQKVAQQERAAELLEAQKKLDLKNAAAILSNVSDLVPVVVSENVSGIAKMLDGSGKSTFKASLDMNSSISKTAADLAKRISMDQEAFHAAGINPDQVKQMIYNLQTLAENAKKRANEVAETNRGVSKHDLGVLKKQIDALADGNLLLRPDNAVGTTIRDGKSIDAGKHLAQLRQN